MLDGRCLRFCGEFFVLDDDDDVFFLNVGKVEILGGSKLQCLDFGAGLTTIVFEVFYESLISEPGTLGGG